MATGTGAGLLDSPKAQSVYKHGLLDQYVIQFATMTASRLTPKRAVLVDGFAGRGRFSSSEPGSAEYMMLAALKAKSTTTIDLLLVEKNPADFASLTSVADEYRKRGIRVDSYNGECGDHLDDALRLGVDASLFVFLDPCGAVLPMGAIKEILRKRGTWPRTEALVNFSADLIRRAGGQLKKGQLDLGGVAQVDKVCGGDWWRDVALNAHQASGGQSWESAADAVALEYARRLTKGTPYGSVVAPVRRQMHHQPVYYLIFLTAQSHGFWVFGVSAAKAREKWVAFVGPDADEAATMLWDTVDEQLTREHAKAVERITDNLRSLTADGQPKKAVDHVIAIFGDMYGEAKETAFTAALRALVNSGELEFVTRGKKPRDFVFRRVP